jgi:hypothetical protein
MIREDQKEKGRKWHPRWVYLPAAIVLGYSEWVQHGAITAVLLLVCGLGLGVFVELRGRRRRARSE